MVVGFLKNTIIVYVALLVFLFFYQRNLMYFPDKSRPKPMEGAEIASVQTADGLALEGWYFPPQRKDAPVIVYFHGNGGHMGHRYVKIRGYLRLGDGVLLAEYRGYGGNDGSPSEEGFYKDGRAYLDWLTRARGIQNFVLYGESIGSGTAVQMALEYKPKGLVLETPLASLLDIAAQRYFFVPVRLLLKDRFMNTEKIGKINVPLLILHGRKDTTTPFVQARMLFDLAQEPKNFIEFPEGAHNNLYDFGAADYVIEFLKRIEAEGGP